MRRVVIPRDLTPSDVRPRAGRPVGLDGPTMGVAWRLQAWAPESLSETAIAQAVQEACDTVVAQMSTWESGSDLCRFNRAPARTWVRLPDHLMRVVSAALDVADLSGGAFDPTVGPLVDLWGFGPGGQAAAAPDAGRLAAVRSNWRGLRIDRRSGRLFQPGGMALDLSGIAKGYGVDLVASAVEALGVRDFLIEVGGELRGAGVKGNGEPWWVEGEAPPGAALTEPTPLVALHNLSIATSGDWRRAVETPEGRRSHTIDPVTRRPVGAGLASVSVLHPQCMMADAFCTALMVLGAKAEAFAQRHDLAVRFLFRKGEAYEERLSPAFARLLD